MRPASAAGTVLPRINPSRLLIGGTVLLVAVAFSSALWDRQRSREQTLREEETELTNLAGALAGETARSIDALDALLQDIVPLVRGQAVTVQRLHEKLLTAPAVDGLVFFDAGGRLHAHAGGASVPVAPPPHGPLDALTIAPGSPDGAGELSLLVARRIGNPSGALAGTLVAAMNARRLHAIFGAIRLPPGGFVDLYRSDGTLLVRSRQTQANPPLEEQPALSALLAQAPALVRLAGPRDKGRRVVALQPVNGFPLTVAVGMSEEAALAPLRAWSQHLVLRWVVISAVLFGLVLVGVRELKRREAADARVRDSEERYALAMAGSQEGHWDWDVTRGRLFVSARLMHLMGRDGEDLVTDDGWIEREAIFEEEDRVRRRQALEDHFRGRTGHYECEYRTRRGAEARWLLDRGVALRDGSGGVQRMAGGIMDITERKLGEERLRSQAALLELAHDALIVRDDHDAVIGWNRGAERIYGWSREEAHGKVSHELLRTRFPVPREEIERELERTGHWQGELVHYRKDGAEVIADSRWTIQRDEHGRIVRRLETNNDITERKLAAAEQAHLEQRLREAEKLEALGTLAGGIAHDFNNILGAILGYGDMAHRATPEGSALQRHTGNVLTAAQRAKALVDQILDYSRSQPRPRNPVDVRTVAAETLELLRASLGKEIQLHVECDPVPLVALCDPTQLHQVLMNLCTNAIQAMPAGGTLRVALHREDLPAGRALSHGTLLGGPYVRLLVSDTGTGIDPELLKRMFEPFFTTKAAGKGTGLGLALVHNIVTDLGGAIDVGSIPGQGSSFGIYLPRFDAPAIGDAPAGQLKMGAGQRVMIVEDDNAQLLLAEEMLAALGYEPAGFAAAHEAISALAAAPTEFDAAMIDYVLPGMTGIDLTRRLRAHRTDLPILLLSGYRGPILDQEAQTARIVQVLTKPLTVATLGEALAAITR